MLSTISLMQFKEIKMNDMTLLHHIAFDANMEALEMIKALPYFPELINDANNEVQHHFKLLTWVISLDGLLFCGLHLEGT